MSATTADAVRSEYRELAEQVRNAGLLRRRPVYYGIKVTMTILGLAAVWAALFVVGNSWAALGVAAAMAVVFTQVLFLGHDAGHQQIFKSRRANRIGGLAVGNLLTGLSFGWWVPKHNAHHTPFQSDRARSRHRPRRHCLYRRCGSQPPRRRGMVGPVAGVGLLSPAAARRSGSPHLERSVAAAAGPSRLDRGGVAAGAQRDLLRRGVLGPLPAAGVGLHRYPTGTIRPLPGCSFVSNHTGMPVLAADDNTPFAQRQIVTSRNVSGGRIVTFLMGGLNFQIEHHLFPSMARCNLRRAEGIVRAFAPSTAWPIAKTP